MEHTLGDVMFDDNTHFSKVLILVLMEHTLGDLLHYRSQQ